MVVTAQGIFDNFKRAHPDDSILVYKYTAPGEACSCFGAELLHINLEGSEWLRASKSVTGSSRRRDLFKKSLKYVFSDYDVNVFTFQDDWSRNFAFQDDWSRNFNFQDDWSRKINSKGAVFFRNEYGSDVDIVLS
jgi:hypothetical protein